MFTSKKAQYLNKDFDRISPITNIDTLYYEQAEKSKDTNSSYIIKRRSVGKHLPIRFDISTLAERTYEDIGVTRVSIKDTGLGSNYLDVCVNINYNKNFIVNPSNPEDNKPIYKFQQYTIETKEYVNIQELLKYYEPRDQFSSSINEIRSRLDNINSSITNISNYIDDTSKVAKVLIREVTTHTEYYDNKNTKINGSNNGIYNLIYQPNKNASCLIKVQCISTNTIKNIISLDRAFKHSMDDVSVEQWVFHYDVDSNKITYLKDEHGNEGSFDFRMAHPIYDTDFKNFINNKLYFEPENANIKFVGGGKFEGNEIYNSFNITFTGDAANNIVVNSSNVSISGSGNKIYNSINTSTLIIKKSNNTIINCENSSILVNGNSNYIVNVKGLNVSLGDNNIIIGDTEGCPTNTSTFNNSKLFLTNAVSTALSLNLTNYKTVFGGTSIYFGGIVTTDKYYKK